MLRWTTRVALILVAVMATAAPLSTAQETADKPDIDAVIRLMELSGAGEMGVAMLDQVIGSFQQTMPNVPQEFWDAYREEIDAQELVQLVAPVYAKHLSAQDIAAITEFYESPAGAQARRSAADDPAGKHADRAELRAEHDHEAHGEAEGRRPHGFVGWSAGRSSQGAYGCPFATDRRRSRA